MIFMAHSNNSIVTGKFTSMWGLPPRPCGLAADSLLKSILVYVNVI
jgi:hypothetical protein